MKNIQKLILVSVATFALFSYFKSYAEVDPKQAYQELLEQKAVFVDVRELEEIQSGMIEKALWYPMSRVNQGDQWKSELLTQAKDKNIYVYCRSGRRSESFKNLIKIDHEKVFNVGGFDSLKSLGLPVRQGP